MDWTGATLNALDGRITMCITGLRVQHTMLIIANDGSSSTDHIVDSTLVKPGDTTHNAQTSIPHLWPLLWPPLGMVL